MLWTVNGILYAVPGYPPGLSLALCTTNCLGIYMQQGICRQQPCATAQVATTLSGHCHTAADQIHPAMLRYTLNLKSVMIAYMIH